MADGLVMPDRSEEQEGVFSFYLGEMRARARTAAVPGRAESEEAIGLGMIHETGNRFIQERAYGDPEWLAARYGAGARGL
jgi:hypothetical protein